MPSAQRVLVITGMHRSGTSLLARLASGAGIDMGDQLIGPSKGNRFGHFEASEFVRFHEKALQERGAGTFHPPVEPIAHMDEEGEREASALITRRSEKSLWGWKDPRTILFLRLWSRLLPDAFFVLLYRHPVEVTLSLLRRGLDLEVQLDPRTGIAAWMRYNQQVLDFRESCPERSLLLPIRSVTHNFRSALDLITERTGVRFSPHDLEKLFEPAEMQNGLAATEINWQAILPQEMQLYRRLDELADLSPERTEPEVHSSAQQHQALQACEHLLASLLSSGTNGTFEVSLAERVQYSELQRQVAWQADQIGELQLQLARQAERLRALESLREAHDRIEGTRAWRLVRLYWQVARRFQGRR